MTAEEVKQVYDELKEEGYDNDGIAVALGRLYEQDEITKDQLGALLEPLGLVLKPEFAQMSDEEAKANLWDKDAKEPEEGVTKPEVNESEKWGDEEAPEADESEESDDEDEEEEESESEEESEEKEDDGKEERKEAFRYMGIKDDEDED